MLDSVIQRLFLTVADTQREIHNERYTTADTQQEIHSVNEKQAASAGKTGRENTMYRKQSFSGRLVLTMIICLMMCALTGQAMAESYNASAAGENNAAPVAGENNAAPAAPESHTASTMRLLRYEGTVEIEDAEGNARFVMENARFNSGESMRTGESSSASVSPISRAPIAFNAPTDPP